MYNTLEKLLIGESFNRFSLGDTYDFKFPDFTLSAHEIQFDNGEIIQQRLEKLDDSYSALVDKDDLSKSLMMCLCRFELVKTVTVSDNGSLVIEFQNEIHLKCLTGVDIVDYQWAITKDGNDPHLGFIVAVFWGNKVEHPTS